MANARASQIVVVLNPDGSLVGSAAPSGTSAVTVTSGTITAQPFPAGSQTTNTAPTTSPGATATIATLTPSPAGTYQVEVVTNVGGTVAAIDQANLTLTAGATIARLANGTGSASSNFGPFQFILGGSTTVTVATVAAGTVGSIYGATIIATRVL
jgi:hypothetical protein